MDAARRQLSDLLLDGYRRPPHVTVGLCGFPAASPRFDDDFGPEALAAQRDALDAARIGPFEIEIGRLATFDSVPYLGVEGAASAIAALRRCVATGVLDQPDERYTPHLTVGLYGGSWPLDRVQERIAEFPAGPPVAVRVNEVVLLGYETSDIDGPLAVMGRHDLGPPGRETASGHE